MQRRCNFNSSEPRATKLVHIVNDQKNRQQPPVVKLFTLFVSACKYFSVALASSDTKEADEKNASTDFITSPDLRCEDEATMRTDECRS